MKRNLPIMLALFLGLCIATCSAFGQGISEAATPGPSHPECRPNTAPASGDKLDKLIADENAAFEAGYRTAEAAMRGQEIQPEPGLADERSILVPSSSGIDIVDSHGLSEGQLADANRLNLTPEKYAALSKEIKELQQIVNEQKRMLADYLAAREQPASAAMRPPTINWRSSLNENARIETRRTGKLGFIMFTLNDNCAACVEDEKRYFQDPKIVDRLNEHYVCVKVDASKIAPATLRRWGVRTVPHYIVTDANWNLPGTRLRRWTSEQFYERLEVIQTPRDRNVSSTTKYPTRFAVYRKTGYDLEENFASSPQAEATQLDLNEPPTGWRPRATASYASNGSQGGYGGAANYGGERIVYVMSGNGYSAGSSGGYGGMASGGSSGGYGGMSGGSSGGAYGWAPQSYQPAAYYSQPSYGGGQVVCSGGVCWVQ